MPQSVLRIRITLMRIRIMFVTDMRIRILPFTLMWMRIRILPFTLMRIRILASLKTLKKFSNRLIFYVQYILACHLQTDVDPHPDPAYQFDAAADPNLVPTFQFDPDPWIRIHNLFNEKSCSDSGSLHSNGFAVLHKLTARQAIS
jgi:hypothetical protein